MQESDVIVLCNKIRQENKIKDRIEKEAAHRRLEARRQIEIMRELMTDELTLEDLYNSSARRPVDVHQPYIRSRGHETLMDL